MKNGGSYSGGKQTAKWFSWMSEDYDQHLHTAKEIFEALGFEVECNPDDGLTLVGYDSKTGQEELFINEVAHLAEPGWSLVWRGEDGEVWRHSARGIEEGKMLFRPEVEAALQAAYNAGAQN